MSEVGPAVAEALRRPRSRRLRRGGALAAVALLPFVVFWQAVVGRLLLAPGDGFIYYLPVHVLTGRAWRDGTVPSWNEYSFSGSPLLASGQPAAFYPPNILFTFLEPLAANNVVVLLNLSLAGIGAFLFARKLVSDDAGAVVAGIAFASSGFMYGHLGHQSIEASVAWLPWILYGYELLRERLSFGRFALTSGGLALSLLGGHYQMFFFALLVLAVYAAAAGLVRQGLPSRAAAIAALAAAPVLAVDAALSGSTARNVGFLVAYALLLALAVARPVRQAFRPARAWALGPPRSLGILLGTIAAALGLGAVQLLPTLRIVDHTLRVDPTFDYATSYAFSPSHLLLLLFPYLFGNPAPTQPFEAGYLGEWNLTELSGYPGLACLVLAAAGISRVRRDPRALALAAVGAFVLLIALGATTSIGVVLWHLPPYGDFRAWARYVVALDLAAAVLAAYGVAHLRASSGGQWRAACRRAWLAAGALLTLGLVLPFLPPVERFVSGRVSAAWAIALPVAAALSAAAAAALLRRAARAGVLACCALVALDPFLSFGAFYEWRNAPAPTDARSAYSPKVPPPWGSLPREPGGIERYLFAGYRIDALGYSAGQVHAAKRIRSVNGLDPLAPAPYTTYVGGMTDAGTLVRARDFLTRRSPLLDILRVTLVVAPRNEAPQETPSWLQRRAVVGKFVRYEYEPRVAEAFLVGRALPASANAIAAWASGRRRLDPRGVALVDGECSGCPRGPAGPAGRARRTARRAGKIDVQVDAARPALLVVSENAVPGWRATVDGKEAVVVRADGIALGVPVPSGSHEVSLRYRVPGLRLGAAISLATLLALLAWAAVTAVSRRRVRPSQRA